MTSLVIPRSVSQLYTIQPYLSFNAKKNSDIRIMNDSPISHFYNFEANTRDSVVTLVPDACIEIFFLCDGEQSEVHLYGSPLCAKNLDIRAGQRYFGVRYKPGEMPDFLKINPKLLIDSEYKLQDIFPGNGKLLEKIAKTKAFEEQILLFNQLPIDNVSHKLPTKSEDLAHQIYQLITENNGALLMKDIVVYLGFSDRYINRSFTDKFGYSPKIYALILRFQDTLKKILVEKSLNLTDLASDQGYSDQSHFYREFKKYTTLAPSIFLKKLNHLEGASRFF